MLREKKKLTDVVMPLVLVAENAKKHALVLAVEHASQKVKLTNYKSFLIGTVYPM